MRDLSAPLRVTWAVPADAALAQTLWKRLTEGRVLFAEADVSPEAVEAFCSAVAAVPPGMRLTVLGDVKTLLRIVESLASETLKKMDAVLMPPYPKAETAAPLAAFRKLSVGLWSDPTGLLTFPEALALAEGLGAASVAIRNPDAPARPLLSEDRARAVAAYAKNPIGLERLTVHDLFLSEAFGLDPLRDYAGCAGAGTLAHVTAAGALVACRTLPLPLGNLAERPLAELWASPERKAARMRLSHTPDACAPCARKDRCRGGCPGLAKPDSGGRDASCSLEFN